MYIKKVVYAKLKSIKSDKNLFIIMQKVNKKNIFNHNMLLLFLRTNF